MRPARASRSRARAGAGPAPQRGDRWTRPWGVPLAMSASVSGRPRQVRVAMAQASGVCLGWFPGSRMEAYVSALAVQVTAYVAIRSGNIFADTLLFTDAAGSVAMRSSAAFADLFPGSHNIYSDQTGQYIRRYFTFH
ncbi:hypothetical protein F1559_000550 [Cyanidiococcus yangmingshanensis]|uniref:Uncharacterized protein n=1 Tax=Cyanidiococcus yangmingshanensis TaxID=2690220 RepID=A0A7J7IMU0_9RHOD|nr:hypothetical protein F1559_000550 [Cyanidiococcus yangmingshanensis]